VLLTGHRRQKNIRRRNEALCTCSSNAWCDQSSEPSFVLFYTVCSFYP